MVTDSVLFAFGITMLAGLSTGLGGVIAFFAKKTEPRFLSAALGFSAGVMIYLSLVDIFPKAKDSLIPALGPSMGYIVTTISFFGGILLIAIIDKLVPSYENPHEPIPIEYRECKDEGYKKSLFRLGVFSTLAISIHNFPEGLATFTGALKDSKIGVSIAVAIAIHNIPEGIAVSIPIFYATGKKWKAIAFSFLSGLSEPLGALIGFLLLRNLFNDLTFGILFASVAGIMTYISLDELLPTAEKYGEHHVAIYGLIAGMAVMGFSLILFA